MDVYTKQNIIDIYAIERYHGFAYCRKCVAKLFHSGENNPNYNPNLDRTSRNSIEYGRYVRNVLIRDNFTCVHCGKYDNKNNLVHHLNGYCWDVDNRLNIDNGVTLCEHCHNNFHCIYGRNHNTKEQFLEWQNCDQLLNPDYNPEEHQAREVFCYEDKIKYNSVREASAAYGRNTSSALYAVCNHKQRYNTYKGKHWFWYDEYINMTEEELNYYIAK